MSDFALEIENISKSFDAVKALDGVSFGVPKGSVFGLLGPNGAGKTTLFSIIASFLHADSGSTRVLGVDIDHISELQGRLSILPQDALFQRNVPILEQLAFFRLLDGKTRDEAEAEVEATLEKVGLAEYSKRGVHALSHGMLKRMGIAQAFLGNPEVILLDEPTSGLDPQNAKQIRDLIVELQHTGEATTVISSHNMLEIQEMCDHVAILDHGKLITHGSVQEITRAGRQLEMTFGRPLTDQQRDALANMQVISAIEQRGPERYRLMLDLDGSSMDEDAGIAAVLRSLLDLGAAPRSFKEGNSLEEFFLQVTGKESEGAE
ncbi:MAG: ABC transporter ATP-binding protein [Planctomycetota bacterium]|nr:ABC transporter ATP-binding protein [Planctomycetota bacterium]